MTLSEWRSFSYRTDIESLARILRFLVRGRGLKRGHIIQTTYSWVCGRRDSRRSCRHSRGRPRGRRPDFRLPAQRHAAVHLAAGRHGDRRRIEPHHHSRRVRYASLAIFSAALAGLGLIRRRRHKNV